MDLTLIRRDHVFVANPDTNRAHTQKREYVVAAVDDTNVVFVVLNADGSQIMKPAGRNAPEPFVVVVAKPLVAEKYICIKAPGTAQVTEPHRGIISRRYGGPRVVYPEQFCEPASLFD